MRERYSRRFEHILVDEFQDTNIAQYTLLRYLAYVNKNIYVVGDEDQSIYRWRGADYHNVERFVCRFPGYDKDPAGTELPLHPDGTECRQGGDRPQPASHTQTTYLPNVELATRSNCLWPGMTVRKRNI